MYAFANRLRFTHFFHELNQPILCDILADGPERRIQGNGGILKQNRNAVHDAQFCEKQTLLKSGSFESLLLLLNSSECALFL